MDCIRIPTSHLSRQTLGARALKIGLAPERWGKHARGAVATANTTLAIPGVLVIAVDLGLWQLIVRGVVQLPSQIVEERLEPRIEELFGLSIPVGASWEACPAAGRTLCGLAASPCRDRRAQPSSGRRTTGSRSVTWISLLALDRSRRQRVRHQSEGRLFTHYRRYAGITTIVNIVSECSVSRGRATIDLCWHRINLRCFVFASLLVGPRFDS